MLVGPSKCLKQIIQIELNRVKNPNWLEANQLAIYKHGQGFELGTTVNKSSWRSEQRAKKVVSDIPGQVDFAIGPVNFVLKLFLRNSNYRRTVKSILLIKIFLGLVEMTFGLVHASFSLPEWQALKTTFFAPWVRAGLKLGASQLQVRRSNHSATLPPDRPKT